MIDRVHAGYRALAIVIVASFVVVLPAGVNSMASEAPDLTAQTRSTPPTIIDHAIPYPAARLRQMASYSFRHYGQRSWTLSSPRQIVLHYTATSSYPPVWSYFSANQPGLGPGGTRPERPGNCTHFVVDKDGDTYQLVPLTIMCRATIGLNHRSISIEFVERNSASEVLARPRQLRAGLALVRWLQGSYGISDSDVIGHKMANKSRFFVDLAGWRNDHTDWNSRQVALFRSSLR